MGSPSFRAAHPLPAFVPTYPVQTTFSRLDPHSKVPLLSQMARPPFTACTKWLGPTAPFVSGGVPVIVALERVLPWPNTLTIGVGAPVCKLQDWSTGSPWG